MHIIRGSHCFVVRELIISQRTGIALDDKAIVAVLFSAHWCGPCRAFLPQLRDFYEACKKKDEDALEVW